MPKTDQSEIILKGRLNGSQRNRLAKLLDMMYRPSELAQEIGFTTRQVYRMYIPLGLPHERDNHRHLWINGIQFREWYLDTYKKRKLGINQAFCLTCKKPVEMLNPIRKQHEKIIYFECSCPICGRKLARIIHNRRAKK